MAPLMLSTGAPVRDHRNAVRNRSESLAAFNRNGWPHSSESACWRLDMTGWTKEDAEAAMAFCREHGVRAHPRCIEAVMFSAEDEWGQHNAYHLIQRPPRGRATLGPLIFDPEGGTYEGRMVGLMAGQGTSQ
jgi:hypothetical protein